MSKKRFVVLFYLLAFISVATAGGWVAGRHIISPAEAAARTAPPTPSPILVPIEARVLSSTIVTRGTARFGLPRPISIAPSALKPKSALINTLPLRNTPVKDGSVLLTASGRPVFVLQGDIPTYRDLVPGINGNDVRQLERGLMRLGFNPGPIDGAYDAETAAAVAHWYEAAGWEPFGPTLEQLAAIHTLEQNLTEAMRAKLVAASAAESAAGAVQSARASAAHKVKIAVAEVEARIAAQLKLTAETTTDEEPLLLQSARATADHAKKTALAEIATKISDRALISLDPRSGTTAKKAADAQLEVARASLVAAELQSELAVKAGHDAKLTREREIKLAAEQLELARAALEAAELEAKVTVQSAQNAQKAAEFDAKLAQDRVARIAADLDLASRKVGVQVPSDELVFIPSLPVRVDEISVLVGATAGGTVMTVTDNQLAIDSSLPLDTAPLVRPGMIVDIDESALGIKAKGVVEWVANTPGTRGVDAYHMYFEVRVVQTPVPLQGFSLRLTIPVKSTNDAVTTVPISALSFAADGKSRIQVEANGLLKTVVVEPGLSADGFVEVTPVEGRIEPGQLVVVGYKTLD